MSAPQPDRRPEPMPQPMLQPQRSSLLSRRSLLLGAGVVAAAGVIGVVASQLVGAGSLVTSSAPAGGSPGQLRPGGDPNNWMDYFPSETGVTGSRFQAPFDMRTYKRPEGSILPDVENVMMATPDTWQVCAPGRQALGMPSGTGGIELCICLDTTGSMGGVLSAAKASIQSCLQSVAQTGPMARVAIILYRDYGDAYVTRVMPLRPASDPALVSFIQSAEAVSGADWPEALGPALSDASRLEWSARPGLVVVVADAPGHRYDQAMIDGAISRLAGSGRRVSFIDSGAAGLQATARAAGGSYISWNGDFSSSLRAAICQ